MTTQTQKKLASLRHELRGYNQVVVAFSGGVDSTFLLKIAAEELGNSCHALTCASETMAQSELADAKRLGRELGLGPRHRVVTSHELAQPGFADNPTHRCALCKTELMDIAEPIAAELNAVVLLGTNTDDLGDYRPGIAAATQRGAIAPMVNASLSKVDIRNLSRELGLRTWNKPQLACLSSRFPHGTKITPDRLRRVDEFEEQLRALGFSQLRVRFHDEIARLELAAEELHRAMDSTTRDAIVALGQKLGFRFVTLDLQGFRSGSLNPIELVQLRRDARAPSPTTPEFGTQALEK